MEYNLIRSKRKTIAIHIRRGQVEVRAPLQVSKRTIEQFVVSKRDWIEDKLLQWQEQSANQQEFRLHYGDRIRYRGRELPIMTHEEEAVSNGSECTPFVIPPGLSGEQVKKACIQMYCQCAEYVIGEKVELFAGQMNVCPATVKVSKARTRWGSCSAKKHLRFSWQLLMADDTTIDYVVVHELAHMIEMNHSVRFWNIVEQILPDYRIQKKKLRELERRLANENWQ